ncbi:MULTISPECIES: substrate-binding domain-containing protein [Subtercola]|nr:MULTISPECIES: substrate-binding domain-containing protein [Subtercola]MEA9984668.1 substrate-binding domain-containing protein [Subtercola sp. RTI3]
MKRIIQTVGAVSIATSLLLVASACSSTTTATPSTPGAKSLTIAFVMGAEADPFFKAMKVGATAETSANGDKLIWQGDPSLYSPATQIPIVDQVLAQKPDCLVLIPTDPDALQASVAKATAAKIPVVNVDTHVTDLSNVVSFITGDNTQGGAAAADQMATAIGYKAGGSYKVVAGLTSATATTNVDRLKGFEDQLAAKYPGVTVVDTAYSQSQPATANSNVSNWLTKYPDLAGIFAIDGTNATGASSALQAKGLTGKVALIGYDAYKTNVDLIAKGVFTALIAQNPAEEAKQAIDACQSFIQTGKSSIAAKVTLPNITMNKDTSAADLTKYTYVQ